MLHLPETGVQGDLGDVVTGPAQVLLGFLNPQRENVAVRCRSKTIPKSSLKMPFTQAGNAGEILKFNLPREVCANIVLQNFGTAA